MKILLLSTYSKGGAGLACYRLYQSLQKASLDIIFYAVKSDNNINTSYLDKFYKWCKEKYFFLFFVLEKLSFLKSEASSSVRFAFSNAQFGVGVPKNIANQTDIIHLHWINQGFLSLAQLGKLFQSNKPIVWTLHDMWAFTGGCHYSGDCNNYLTSCGQCKFLKSPDFNDLSHQIWNNKKLIFQSNPNIVFVACSQWMQKKAQQSSLLKGFRVEQIPSPIDTAFFKPSDKTASRKKLDLRTTKRLFLFSAMNVTDPRKGFTYLVQATKELQKNYPKIMDDIAFLLVGKNTSDAAEQLLPFECFQFGYVDSASKMTSIYNASDFLIVPSLEDNLPNTIVEAMSCGLPVIGFDKGGIPEMISHAKDGFIASFDQENALSHTIHLAYNFLNIEEMKYNARKKAVENYSQEVVNQKYIAIYNQLMN